MRISGGIWEKPTIAAVSQRGNDERPKTKHPDLSVRVLEFGPFCCGRLEFDAGYAAAKRAPGRLGPGLCDFVFVGETVTKS
jgi:hypothetical protein